MERNEKKDYQKPEIVQHENLNEVTKGEIVAPDSNPQV